MSFLQLCMFYSQFYPQCLLTDLIKWSCSQESPWKQYLGTADEYASNDNHYHHATGSKKLEFFLHNLKDTMFVHNWSKPGSHVQYRHWGAFLVQVFILYFLEKERHRREGWKTTYQPSLVLLYATHGAPMKCQNSAQRPVHSKACPLPDELSSNPWSSFSLLVMCSQCFQINDFNCGLSRQPIYAVSRILSEAQSEMTNMCF